MPNLFYRDSIISSLLCNTQRPWRLHRLKEVVDFKRQVTKVTLKYTLFIKVVDKAFEGMFYCLFNPTPTY